MRLPLSAQCFACLLTCVSAAASRGQGPPRERVKSVLPLLRYSVPACHSGPNEYPNPENFVIDDPLHLLHQQPQPQPQPSPMTSPKKPGLVIIRSLRRGLEWDRVYRHSRPKGEAAPGWSEICEDVNHHREIKGELQALGYEHAWQRKQWRVWRDSRYVTDFSPDLHQEDQPVEELSAPSQAGTAATREPPPWTTSWRSPEDPSPSPPVQKKSPAS